MHWITILLQFSLDTHSLHLILFTLQTGDMTVVNPLFSDQEVVGSDQDGNGDKSGASGQGSPVPPRHSFKES